MEPICPWCGEPIDDSIDEWTYLMGTYSFEMECPNCYKSVYVEVKCQVKFTCVPYKGKDTVG